MDRLKSKGFRIKFHSKDFRELDVAVVEAKWKTNTPALAEGARQELRRSIFEPELSKFEGLALN